MDTIRAAQFISSGVANGSLLMAEIISAYPWREWDGNLNDGEIIRLATYDGSLAEPTVEELMAALANISGDCTEDTVDELFSAFPVAMWERQEKRRPRW